MKPSPTISRRLARRGGALLALAAVLAGAVALFIATSGNSPGEPSASGGSMTRMQSVDARFAVLSTAHSNRCDLGAAEMRSMPDGMRLQGSCCFPMDRAVYKQQLRGLRHYAGDRLVPPNPYDVPVTVAKRLLDHRRIALTRSQRAVYRRASAKSKLGGPCCCRCWRWQAFKGQARFMIARRHYSASRVARLWEFEAGCGGSET